MQNVCICSKCIDSGCKMYKCAVNAYRQVEPIISAVL